MSRDGRLDLPGKVAYEGQEESNCMLIFTEKSNFACYFSKKILSKM